MYYFKDSYFIFLYTFPSVHYMLLCELCRHYRFLFLWISNLFLSLSQHNRQTIVNIIAIYIKCYTFYLKKKATAFNKAEIKIMLQYLWCTHYYVTGKTCIPSERTSYASEISLNRLLASSGLSGFLSGCHFKASFLYL